MASLFLIIVVYILLNLYVTKKINKSFYLNEARRRFHKRFIWLIPFIGPLLVRGFWREQKDVKMETMTKKEREKQKGSFYESGAGLSGE